MSKYLKNMKFLNTQQVNQLLPTVINLNDYIEYKETKTKIQPFKSIKFNNKTSTKGL